MNVFNVKCKYCFAELNLEKAFESMKKRGINTSTECVNCEYCNTSHIVELEDKSSNNTVGNRGDFVGRGGSIVTGTVISGGDFIGGDDK